MKQRMSNPTYPLKLLVMARLQIKEIFTSFTKELLIGSSFWYFPLSNESANSAFSLYAKWVAVDDQIEAASPI